MNMRILLLLLVLSVPIFASWADPSATGRVCFNATTSGTQMFSKSGYPSFWSFYVVGLPLNSTFWNGTNYYGSGFDIFISGKNSTHAVIFIPAINNSATQSYCVYTGSLDSQSLSGVAPIYYDDVDNGWTTTANVSYGDIANISSIGTSAFYKTSTSTTITFAKMRVTSLGSGYAGAGYHTSTSSDPVYTVRMNSTYQWVRYNNASFYNDSGYDTWHVLRTQGYGTSVLQRIYDENMTQLNTYTGGGTTAYPWDTGIFLKNASIQLDWFAAGRLDSATNTFSVAGVAYDYQDLNISIQSPTELSEYDYGESVTVIVMPGKSYDNCTLYLNGVAQQAYPSAPAGGVLQSTLTSANYTFGENIINMSCYLSGVESHAYRSFLVVNTEAASLFESAFGVDVGAICPAATITAIGNCLEYYNITYPYPFAAVACYNLNTSANYSCLGVSNYTKNNYTIFYNPNTFSYATATNTSHVGAMFMYQSARMDGRIELISNTKFIYIPAQNKTRDCGVYYSSVTEGCSWWEGFVLNNGTIYVSDAQNNWYTAAGLGIEQFNINYSQTVVAVSLVTLANQNTSSLLPNGIYTRLNCYERGGYYIINARNTNAHNFSVNVSGNVTYGYSTYSTTISQNISLANVSNITVSDGIDVICNYGSETGIFLPFDMPDITIAGYYIIPWVGLLFSLILSAISPFALFIAFILNDTYHILSVPQIAMMAVFSVIAGFVNSAFSYDRTIKHLIVIVCLVLGYLSILSEYDDSIGMDLNSYTGFATSLKNLMDSNNIWSFTLGLASFIISLFILVLSLPLQFVMLVYGLLGIISKPLYTAFVPMRDYIAIAFMAFFYLKAYEVISNRFQKV